MQTFHRMSRSAEYRIFQGMHQRCENPSDPGYKDYGGRGIIVDPRWRTFEQFFADKGLRPNPYHSLDRIDNDGPYSPENTRWATHIEQHRNNRRNHLLTVNNETHCISQWAEMSGVAAETILSRVRSGKSPDEYLTPVNGMAHGSRNGNARLNEERAKALYALKGTMTQRSAAKIFGVHQTVVGDLWRKEIWKHIHN